MNVLGIGLDQLMLKDDKVRGDVRQRQFDYAKQLVAFSLIVYSHRELACKAEKWADNLWIYPTDSKNKTTFILDALKISSQLCQQRKIDVITTEDPFTTGLVGYWLKKRHGIPLNVQVHNDFCDNSYWISIRRINKLFNMLGKFILKRADTIRVGTQYEKKKLSKLLKIKEDKISVIPVNSDIRRFQAIDCRYVREKYLQARFDRLLLFTGRLVLQKDIQTLLRAFQIVVSKRPLTLLLIVGSGREEGGLKKITLDFGIQNNVIFTGSIDHSLIPEYVSACDVYTISSIFEGTCIAMAEAMAAGKPVVATRFAGAMDLIEDGKNGYVVEQKNYKEMAERILFLLGNPDIAKKMGECGARRVEKIFTNNKNIDRMIELLNKTAR